MDEEEKEEEFDDGFGDDIFNDDVFDNDYDDEEDDPVAGNACLHGCAFGAYQHHEWVINLEVLCGQCGLEAHTHSRIQHPHPLSFLMGGSARCGAFVHVPDESFEG